MRAHETTGWNGLVPTLTGVLILLSAAAAIGIAYLVTTVGWIVLAFTVAAGLVAARMYDASNRKQRWPVVPDPPLDRPIGPYFEPAENRLGDGG